MLELAYRRSKTIRRSPLKELEQTFTRAATSGYLRASELMPAVDFAFGAAVVEQGGAAFARADLAKAHPSSDTLQLLKAGYPQFTIEYLVCLPAFRDLFTEHERQVARARLGVSAPPPRISSLIPPRPTSEELSERLRAYALSNGLRVSDTGARLKLGNGTRSVWLKHATATLTIDLRGTPRASRESVASSLKSYGFDVEGALGIAQGVNVLPQWDRFTTDVLHGYFDLPRTTAAIDPRHRPSATSLQSLIAEGESQFLELKSSARWDYELGRTDKRIEREVLKSVAGFMNSRDGGFLLLGVDDAGQVIGLRRDLASISPKGEDGYENWLTTLLGHGIGKPRLHLIRMTRVTFGDELVYCLGTSPSSSPVFVEWEGKKTFFLRINNSTRTLDAEEMISYVSERFS